MKIVGYSMLRGPSKLSEVTKLLERKGATSVEMNFGYIEAEYGFPGKVAPVCDYVAQTPKGKMEIRYIFADKNNIFERFAAGIPLIGDAAILNFKSNSESLDELRAQREEIKTLGIEVTSHDI